MTICLLLAGGNSSRMQDPGHGAVPKMLLPFRNKTLLQHSIDEIKKLPGTKLLVVTGCYHFLMEQILQQQQIDFVENKEWEEGMGSSIRNGITFITQHYSDTDNVIIIVCDQPYLSSGLLTDLIECWQTTNKGIVASFYNDTFGTPVLFNKRYFRQLAALSGPHGAKKIVQQFNDDVATVPFPSGEVDIDTPEDYQQLEKE